MWELAERYVVSRSQAMDKDGAHRMRKKNKGENLKRTAVNLYIHHERSVGQCPTERSIALGDYDKFPTRLVM